MAVTKAIIISMNHAFSSTEAQHFIASYERSLSMIPPTDTLTRVAQTLMILINMLTCKPWQSLPASC